MKKVEELRIEYEDLIVQKLEGMRISAQSMGNRLWMSDSLYKQLFDSNYTEETMLSNLTLELQNRGCDQIADKHIEIQAGTPPTNPSVTIIKADLISCEPIVVGNATVEMIPTKGSLQERSYDLKLKNGAVYNIGFGVMPPMEGTFRENHIAVNENEADAQQMDINRHVSRAHADIRVMKGGFYLHATKRGCMCGTKIIRNGKDFKIKNEMVSLQLYDQDIIVLGGKFMMRFKLG